MLQGVSYVCMLADLDCNDSPGRFSPFCTVPEGAAVDDAVCGRESAVEVGGHAVRHDLGVRGQARALAPRAPAEAPAAVPPAGGDDIIIIVHFCK